IKLGPDDFTTPPLSMPLSKNLAIKLTRVTIRFSEAASENRPVVTWHQETRENLRQALVEKGHWTERIQKIRTVLYDGVEAKHSTVSQKRVRHPFYTLTLFDKKGFPE